MKDLRETIEMMTSEDYKERFKAEFLQTQIRYEKLHRMLVSYEEGTLPFTPTCPVELLEAQKNHMSAYLKCMAYRAQLEGIDLENNCEAG